MRKLLLLFLSISVFALSSCDFIKSSFRHKDISKAFLTSLINKDYPKCIGLMDTNRAIMARFGMDTIKMMLEKARNVLVTNFGEKLDISFMGNSQTVTFIGDEKKDSSNTSTLSMQIENAKEFGAFKFVFDNNNDRVRAFNLLDIKAPIPSLFGFWIFTILSSIVLIFNISTIVKVKRSALKWKFGYYLLIILINVPTIGYNVINGFFFSPVRFEGLLGIGFSMMGYISTYSSFGLPLGSLFALWMIRKKSNTPEENEDSVHENKITETEEGESNITNE
ncbi:MAG TPA: hypothetical protein VNZ45_14390 [Bacteroidia bacterium]|jgi:hypothetical protein|nr:hypothetical protein [Bacteroidia bacterium]